MTQSHQLSSDWQMLGERDFGHRDVPVGEVVAHPEAPDCRRVVKPHSFSWIPTRQPVPPIAELVSRVHRRDVDDVLDSRDRPLCNRVYPGRSVDLVFGFDGEGGSEGRAVLLSIERRPDERAGVIGGVCQHQRLRRQNLPPPLPPPLLV